MIPSGEAAADEERLPGSVDAALSCHARCRSLRRRAGRVASRTAQDSTLDAAPPRARAPAEPKVPVVRELAPVEMQWVGALGGLARAPRKRVVKEEGSSGAGAASAEQGASDAAATIDLSVFKSRAVANPHRVPASYGGRSVRRSIPRGAKAAGAVVRRREGERVVHGAPPALPSRPAPCRRAAPQGA
jgi:hypothetical protein